MTHQEVEVSIAKAIPSLLEPVHTGYDQMYRVGFNRESDSVTVGAKSPSHRSSLLFRFNRESDSVTVGAVDCRA